MNNLEEFMHFFPDKSKILVRDVSSAWKFHFNIKYERKSKLGDFRYPINGHLPIITVNADQNEYSFLITYIHELAHLIVWEKFRTRRKPHGQEWKLIYGELLANFCEKEIFPPQLDKVVLSHCLKPKASTHADVRLLAALKEFDPVSDKSILLDIDHLALFRLENGRVFRKGELRRTRVLCEEMSSGKKYLIHAHASVTALE